MVARLPPLILKHGGIQRFIATNGDTGEKGSEGQTLALSIAY
jgi:hypothetical protein